VDADAANAYRAASEEQRRKLDLLLSLRIKDATRSGESLEQVMREISRKAQERGLTPEILKSLLDEQ
jgi:predicted metalloprotease with PDZ domain